ncbi:MAG TPA: hypothetical protein VGG19_05295 [Tepidisphaeraceae bacterium]
MKYFSCAVLVGAMAIGGCVSESAPDTKGYNNYTVTEMPAYEFNLSPSELIEKIKQSLSTMGITIAQDQGSVLITNYKNYPGSFHIVRRWQERTRYRITVFPDAADPARRSHLEISCDSQTRASSQEPWHTWAEYQRPQRAAMLAKSLHDQIQQSAVAEVPVAPAAPPAPAPAAPPPAAPPADAETVMVTYHVIPGKEEQLQADLNKAWEIYTQQNLVVASPHQVLKDKDATGKPCFVEVFSWVDHQAPERVSDAVKNLWDDMHSCCEDRDGHPGVDGHEVSRVDLSGGK